MFYFAFAVDVAPAMAQLDAATYITVQQSINRVVRGAVFGAVYFGSTILPFAAALAAYWTGRRVYAGFWLVIALAYFLAVFWVTRSINVPINNELATWSASAPPDAWMQARDAWNESNLVRAVAATICFACSVALATSSRFRANGASVA